MRKVKLVFRIHNISKYFSSILHKICDIIRPASNKTSVKVPPVQHKLNQVDCGIFSIDYSVALTLGDNPALVT